MSTVVLYCWCTSANLLMSSPLVHSQKVWYILPFNEVDVDKDCFSPTNVLASATTPGHLRQARIQNFFPGVSEASTLKLDREKK